MLATHSLAEAIASSETDKPNGPVGSGKTLDKTLSGEQDYA